MGDKTFWWENCPKCGIKDAVNVYDAPSCLDFSRRCRECGWTDGNDYYEIDGVICLLTKEEYDHKTNKR